MTGRNDAACQAIDESWTASTRILVSLRRLQGLQLARDANRDPAFLVPAATIIFAVIAVARRIFNTEPIGLPNRFGCEFFCAGLVFTVVTNAIKRSEGEGLASGPFHVLLARRGRRTTWLLVEAAVLFTGMTALLTLALITLDPLRAPAFLAASLLGMGGAATVLRSTNRRAEPLATAMADEGGPPEILSLNGPLLIARLQWRRRLGPSPAWVAAGAILVVGGLATALAIRNNSEPSFASGVLGATGLIGGLVFASLDIDLLRFSAREPGSLLSLIGAFTGLPPLSATVAVLIIASLAGLPPASSIFIAVSTGVAIFVYSTVILLHALGGATRFPIFAAGIELTIMLFMAAVFGPLAGVWTIGRGVMLVRSARRLRWRDL